MIQSSADSVCLFFLSYAHSLKCSSTKQICLSSVYHWPKHTASMPFYSNISLNTWVTIKAKGSSRGIFSILKLVHATLLCFIVFILSNNEKTLVLNCQHNNNKKDVFYYHHYNCCFNIYSLVDNLTLWLRLTFPRINASLKYLYIFISNV